MGKLWILFIVCRITANCLATSTEADDCDSSTYSEGYFSTHAAQCVLQSNLLIYCEAKSSDQLANELTNLHKSSSDWTENTTIALKINCRNEWSNFENLYKVLEPFRSRLSDLDIQNCRFNDTRFDERIFNGLLQQIVGLSITCCFFVSTVSLPEFNNWSNLKRLTLHQNKFYPMTINPDKEDLCVYFPVEFVNAEVCDSKFLTVGQCFCNFIETGKGSQVNVSCIGTLESETLGLLEQLGKPIKSLKCFEFIINSLLNSAFGPVAHMLAIPKHLSVLYPEMVDLRFRKCRFTKGNLTVINYKYRPQIGTLAKLTISDCPEQNGQNLWIMLSSLAAPPEYEGMQVEFSQNGINSLIISGDYEQKIVDLNLYGNNFSQILPDTFLPFGSNLKRLNLRQNAIQTIQNGAFDSLTNLETLDLAGNNLKMEEITSDIFSPLVNLHKLTVGQKVMTFIPGNFEPMINLSELEIIGLQQADKISPGTLIGLGSLKILRIGNVLRTLPRNFFRPAYSLAEVFIDDIVNLNVQTAADIMDDLQTVRKMTATLIDLPTTCEGLRKFPLLSVFRSAGEQMICDLPLYPRLHFTLSWLKYKMDAGDIILENKERLKCIVPGNVTFIDYLASLNVTQDLEQMRNESMPSPSTKFNWSVITPVFKASTPNINLGRQADIFTICVTCIFLFMLVAACMLRPETFKSFVPTRNTFYSWVWGDYETFHELTQTFYETTQIGGFAQAWAATSKLEKMLWHALIVTFVGLTARGVADQYLEWKNAPPQMTMTLVTNSTYAMPPFYICLPVVQRHLDLTDSQLDKIIKNQAPCETGEKVPFSNRLFADIAWHRIGHLLAKERSEMPQLIPNSMNFNFSHFDHLMREANVSVLELQGRLSAQMCHFLNIRARLLSSSNHKKNKVTTEVLTPANCSDLFSTHASEYGVVWFDDTYDGMVCLRFPGLFYFNADSSTADIIFQPWYYLGINTHFYMIPDGDAFISGTIEKIGVPIPLGYEVELSVQLESVVSLLPYDVNGKPRCSTDNCFSTLRLKDIEQRCHCRPHIWKLASNTSLPECTEEIIDKHCNVTPGIDNCASAIDCVRTKYMSTITKSLPTSSGDSRLITSMIVTSYTSFVEQQTQSISDLVANWGGVLGFYLNITLLALIQLAFWIVRLFYTAVRYGLNLHDRRRSTVTPGLMSTQNGLTPTISTTELQ